MKRTFTVHTKINKNAASKATVLTMDYEGVTKEALIGPAEDSLVINLQGRWRRAGGIPQLQTVKVGELIASLGKREGVQISVEGLAAAATTMSKEDRAALIAKLAEMDKAAEGEAAEETEEEVVE